MKNRPHDPRIIANMILDEGDENGFPLTNLALQKLLYFVHAIYLVEKNQPLVSGYFEAWQYGPVHTVVYQAFKKDGGRQITSRAKGKDIFTGKPIDLELIDDLTIRRHIKRIVSVYGGISAGRLVDISHAKGAPWSFVVEKARFSVALGLRISNDIILDKFKYHKISIAEKPLSGEPVEDTPFTCD